MTPRRAPLMEISENDTTSSPAATNNRRKSGRAVRAPEKFDPDAPASQTKHTSAKRKRATEDEENDILAEGEEDEQILEGDEVEADADSAVEDAVTKKKRKAKPARKPVAKKPKVNGQLVADEHTTAAKQSKRAKKGKKVAIANAEVGGLYAEVYTTGAESKDVVSDWLQRFQVDMPAALTDLVNFVLKSAGSPSEVTEDHINDPENISSRIQDLQDEYQEHAVSEYPLISKAKSAPAFRASLLGFIEELVEALHATDTMYDNKDLIENIIQWVVCMSTSASRPFRHTATVIALAISSTVSGLLHKSAETTAQNQQLLQAEQRKRSSNKARVADFQNRVQKGAERKEYLEERLQDIFEIVYLNRYRDVDPKIRIECVQGMARWIRTLPEYWVDGQYLRYLGWMLTDSQASMRHEVIKQLIPIMLHGQRFTGLRLFFERFRPRVVEMATQDADALVRAAAIELTDRIRAAGYLEPDDIDVIGRLIFDTEPKVRKAVVNFFVESVTDTYNDKIESLGGIEAVQDFFNDDKEQVGAPRASWIKVKSLAELLLYHESADHAEEPAQVEVGPSGDYLVIPPSESRYTLAAQALFEQLPELKDWDMLASYLLFDHSTEPTGSADDDLKAAFKPTEEEEVILLEILNASVWQSHSQADAAEKKKATKVEGAQSRENMARRLADLIPKLLKKYGASPETAKVVLRLEHALNLDIFQSLRQESTSYARLLDEISAQFRGHGDKDVLSSASAALLHARGYEELEDVTENKVQALWEETIDAIRIISKQDDVGIRGSMDADALIELSHTVARLSQLASISDCVDLFEQSDGATPEVVSILVDLIGRGVFEVEDEGLDIIEDELCLSAARAVFFYFMWKVRSLTEARSRGEDISESVITQLRTYEDHFLQNIIGSVSSRSTLDLVRLQGSGLLLDFCVLFKTLTRPSNNSQTKEDSPLASLSTDLDSSIQVELISIFTALEKHYAKKAKKSLLAAHEALNDQDPEADPASGSDSDLDNDEDDNDEEIEGQKSNAMRQAEILTAEKQLCELTSKLVLAFLAGVLDNKKGRLKQRLQRNRARLGANFKEVLAFLDDDTKKSKAARAKRSHGSKAELAAASTRNTAPGHGRDGREQAGARRVAPEENGVVVVLGSEDEEGEANGDEDDSLAGDGRPEEEEMVEEAMDDPDAAGVGDELDANGAGVDDDDGDEESMLGD